MESEQILAAVDSGAADRRLTVFRFRGQIVRRQALGMGLLGAAILGAAVALRPFVMEGGWAAYGAAALVGLMVLVAGWSLVRALRDLHHAKSSVLVVTREGVLRRVRGRVQTWDFAEYPELNLVLGSRHGAAQKQIDLKSSKLDKELQSSNYGGGRLTAVYLNQPGHTFQRELVSDNRFGPMHQIVRAIVERRKAGG